MQRTLLSRTEKPDTMAMQTSITTRDLQELERELRELERKLIPLLNVVRAMRGEKPICIPRE